jgi:hypothetical protein
MNQSDDLSLEQEFSLKLFADLVQNLTPEQAKEFLIELNRQMMIRENLYRDLLQQYLGIDSTPIPAQGLTPESFDI